MGLNLTRRVGQAVMVGDKRLEIVAVDQKGYVSFRVGDVEFKYAWEEDFFVGEARVKVIYPKDGQNRQIAAIKFTAPRDVPIWREELGSWKDKSGDK